MAIVIKGTKCDGCGTRTDELLNGLCPGCWDAQYDRDQALALYQLQHPGPHQRYGREVDRS